MAGPADASLVAIPKAIDAALRAEAVGHIQFGCIDASYVYAPRSCALCSLDARYARKVRGERVHARTITYHGSDVKSNLVEPDAIGSPPVKH